MNKNNGQYIGKYLKKNAVVLACELAVVLLLSLICCIIMEAKPMWLTPVIAVVTYLIAELRFMMAYVATNMRQDRKAVAVEDESEDVQPEQQEEDQSEIPAAATVASVALAGQDDTAEQENAAAAEESYDMSETNDEPETDDENDSVDQDEAVAQDEAEAENEPQVDKAEDDFSREVRQQLNQFMNERKDRRTVEQLEPVFDEMMDEEDEAMDALLTVSDEPVAEKDLELESVDVADDDVDDMTMDEDDLARDVLEIGEVGLAESNAD